MKKVAGKISGSRRRKKGGIWVFFLILCLQVLGGLFFGMGAPGPVEALTFTVNSTLDQTDASPGNGVCATRSGTCTLRAAIQEANTGIGPDVIKLKPGLYILSIPGRSEDGGETGDLDITDDLAIVGTDAKKTFIDGAKLDRVFDIQGAISVSLSKVTIQNGYSMDGRGGAIYSYLAALKITGCTLSSNVAIGASGSGGAVYSNYGELTVEKSVISNNLVKGTESAIGGGIRYYGPLTITGSTLSMNTARAEGDRVNGSGGAIAGEGTVTITKSSFFNNEAFGTFAGKGGAINHVSGTATVTASTLSNNRARGIEVAWGGAIDNAGTLTLTKSSVSNNSALGSEGYAYGGGILNWVTLTVTGSVLSNNTAAAPNAFGGGISKFSRSTTTVTASTLSNNTALGTGGDLADSSSSGGGIYVLSATLTVVGSRIQDNTASWNNGSSLGGGICANGGQVTVDSSTLSGNAAAGYGPGFSGGNGGGIFHWEDTTLTVQNRSKFIQNFASDHGGAIFLFFENVSISNDTTFAWNRPDDIYYYDY